MRDGAAPPLTPWRWGVAVPLCLLVPTIALFGWAAVATADRTAEQEDQVYALGVVALGAFACVVLVLIAAAFAIVVIVDQRRLDRAHPLLPPRGIGVLAILPFVLMALPIVVLLVADAVWAVTA